MSKLPFEMDFDIGTIKHLGLQMYSTLPPVVGELVSNAWDADATRVVITLPAAAIDDASEITVVDDGEGMTDEEVRAAYLVVGRDRRQDDGDKPTDRNRKVMGRKGIGKFSAFGIATEIEVETVKDGETSRFKMNYTEMAKLTHERKMSMPALEPTGTVIQGTKITLRGLTKFKNRSIAAAPLRRALARRFSIIGPQHEFEVVVNGDPITPDERDLQRLLDKDVDGNPYLWLIDEEIKPDTGWKATGWIGALDRTKELEAIQRGIVIMARGKMVQEPFVFEATVGQQFALSYLVGELHAEFVDEREDTIGTTRNTLVWDTDANTAFKDWGQKTVNRIAREWGEKRRVDNERELAKNDLYVKFTKEAERFDNKQLRRAADSLIKTVIAQSPEKDAKTSEPVIQMCLDFMEFDAFQELADEITAADVKDVNEVVDLFRRWEILEAKEMMRVTEGRIKTIEKLQYLIETNALEVPTLHNFLKEFPWVLDPRWALIADEVKYSQVLRDEFPEDDVPQEDRRIDFLCVSESNSLVVVEIKRPKVKASVKELGQIKEYVQFMRDYCKRTTDPSFTVKEVVGYLLVGDVVDTWKVREERETLAKDAIYIRRYQDLLGMVQANHREFLTRYERLKALKKGGEPPPALPVVAVAAALPALAVEAG